LAVVESTRNSQVVDVLFCAGRHLHLLDRANAALGVEDGDCDIFLAAETVNSGGAGLKISILSRLGYSVN
jgi:hypothetical protein